MFEGRYSLALGPDGKIILPARIRKAVHGTWGDRPHLLCFGAQFLYLCREDQAEALLARVDRQLCTAFGGNLTAVTQYLLCMQDSVARLELEPEDGMLILPQRLMERLDAPRGGLMLLLGVDDHLEIWNSAQLQQQSEWLEQQMQAKTPARTAPENTPICLQPGEVPCTLLRGGLPVPRNCGPCVYLRLP